MKNIISAALLAAGLGFGGAVSAADVVEVIPFKDMNRVIEIDTFGVNKKVYEFTPKSYPNKICLMVFSGHGTGLTCFNKPDTNKTCVNNN